MAPQKSVPDFGAIFAFFVPLKSSAFPQQGQNKTLLFFWNRRKM